MPKDVVRKSIRIPDTSRASASTGGCTSGVEPRGQVGSEPGSDVVLDFVLGDCIPGIKKFVKPGSVDVVEMCIRDSSGICHKESGARPFETIPGGDRE